MPIYKYRCTECEHILTAMHSSKEVRKDCEECEGTDTLVKLLNKVHVKKSTPTSSESSSTGELTKKFIEENREILKNQKEEVRARTYDKS